MSLTKEDLEAALTVTKDELRDEFRNDLRGTKDELRDEFRNDLRGTKDELRDEFRNDLRGMKDELRDEFRNDLRGTKDELVDTMRQIETSLLTEFHRYAKGQQVRLHALEMDESALKQRLATIEERLLALEFRRPAS